MKKCSLALNLLLVFVFIGKAQQTPSADAVLKEARTRAANQNKNVIVIFHASWCVWCHKMDRSLNDSTVKDFFDKSYVITHLVVSESADKKKLENPGAEDLFKKWGGENQGIPFWVVMDKEGNVLADSKDNGNNVGCPATEKEVTHFIEVLKKTSTINDEQISLVVKRFRRNE